MASALSSSRRALVGIFFFGAIGVVVDLLLQAHFESPTQLLPLGGVTISSAALVLHLRRPNRQTFLVLRVALLGLFAIGLMGVVLHGQSSMAMQAEMDPTLGKSDLVLKALRAKVPPLLAPALLVQLALIGLVIANNKESSQ